MKRRMWGLALLCIAIGIGLIFFWPSKDSNALPAKTVTQASKFMKVYYYKGPPPHNFSLIKDGATVTGGLLTFQLKNDKGQKVTFTQQSLPKELQYSKVESGEKIEGAPGSATATFKEGRTIGTLLTQDKQTMVMANSSDGIDTSAMKDLIRSLKPLED